MKLPCPEGCTDPTAGGRLLLRSVTHLEDHLVAFHGVEIRRVFATVVPILDQAIDGAERERESRRRRAR